MTNIQTIQFGVLIPILVGVALFMWWCPLRSVLEAVPQDWIVGVQLYRAMGVIFLVPYAGGPSAGPVCLACRRRDILVGLLAPTIGIAYARRSSNAAGWLRAWNLFGIEDLIVALATRFPDFTFAIADVRIRSAK
jgi:hypothetical protein